MSCVTSWLMEAVGIIAAALLGVTALFQISLAGGAPWGAASWGGRHPGKLPPSYRIASGVVGVLFYPVVALVALGAAACSVTTATSAVSAGCGS
jgi:hypothetical protein